jgi:hypothetical protein
LVWKIKPEEEVIMRFLFALACGILLGVAIANTLDTNHYFKQIPKVDCEVTK